MQHVGSMQHVACKIHHGTTLYLSVPFLETVEEFDEKGEGEGTHSSEESQKNTTKETPPVPAKFKKN